MKALLQRVGRAEVRVDGEVRGRIGPGLLVLLGCERGDGPGQADRMSRRIAGYRVFPDRDGRTNLDVLQVGGSVLLVSQFTLAADTRKGRRPSFDPALPPDRARELVARVGTGLRERGLRVEEGVFGARMEVELVNLGPATYLLEVPPEPPDGA
ncbi:MAG: D-tyrosyl-tRNA(Tyr) deacylase [Planctomycetota bacterium]|nr:MAG: D-tyrosyl-tRNA(Tyr) deacylase [Planctomycetota bacterium]